MVRSGVPSGHSEFGGGDGLIDAEARKDRAISSAEERMEIMFTNPLDPASDPATANLEAIPAPERYEWPDAATREGTA